MPALTRHFLPLYLTLPLLLMNAAGSSLASAEQMSRGGLFSVQLVTDKTAYRVGELVRVKLTIRNISGTEYGVLAVAPWVLSDLVVLDATGRKVPPSITPTHPGFASRVSLWDLTPGKSATSEYYTLGGSTLYEWSPIAFWGYELSQPGRYTITAAPELTAFRYTSGGIRRLNGAVAADAPSVKIEILK